MRYLTGLGIAVLALMIGGPWLNCSAQPGGSYRQTCKDIGVRGSSLRAQCKDANNQWHETRLDDYQRCHGDIQNIDGRLACNNQGGGYGYNRPGYNNGGAPRDSYRQTCNNIRTDGNTLKASCQKVDGGWRNTSLKDFNRCQRIVNEDGNLRCM